MASISRDDGLPFSSQWLGFMRSLACLSSQVISLPFSCLWLALIRTLRPIVCLSEVTGLSFFSGQWLVFLLRSLACLSKTCNCLPFILSLWLSLRLLASYAIAHGLSSHAILRPMICLSQTSTLKKFYQNWDPISQKYKINNIRLFRDIERTIDGTLTVNLEFKWPYRTLNMTVLWPWPYLERFGQV